MITKHLNLDLLLGAVSYEVLVYQSLDSTNSEAARLLSCFGSRMDRTVIVSKAQTMGRGKGSSIWASPEGNLYCSIILPAEGMCTLHLPVTVAVSMKEALNIEGLRFKWPNDLFFREKKFGGILIESSNQGHHIIGIGINISTSPLNTSSAIGGVLNGLDMEELLKRLLTRLEINNSDSSAYGFSDIGKRWQSAAIETSKPLIQNLLRV